MVQAGQTGQVAEFLELGWSRFPYDSQIANWAARARPVAARTLHNPELRDKWLRCGDTWFAGVNALPNDADGAVPESGVPGLAGAAVDFALHVCGLERISWDPAQVSICFPGYPRPWGGESEAAFRFRRDRDAAHVDGFMRHDPGRRRRLGETHAFILGIPLTEAPPDAAPLVVYEGSHVLMRSALRARFAGIAPQDWAAEDVTETYVAARREAFETCRRVAVPARPGEAYLIHRLALHGVAPWTSAQTDGMRMIAYFRPAPAAGFDPAWWLGAP